ncbi:MAG: hypothetical protein AAGA45_02275, partial [Verrucomicrobiota bacterium]
TVACHAACLENDNTMYQYFEFTDSGVEYFYQVDSGYFTDPEIIPEPRQSVAVITALCGFLLMLRRRHKTG